MGNRIISDRVANEYHEHCGRLGAVKLNVSRTSRDEEKSKSLPDRLGVREGEEAAEGLPATPGRTPLTDPIGYALQEQEISAK